MRLSARGKVVLSAAALGVVALGIAWATTWSPAPVVVAERCLATVDGTTYDLSPEQAANAATIAAVSVRRGLPARAATIAIATAIQESKLQNIAYGDRDSLGLFQQRPSQGWGTAEQVQDPIYATNAFYDRLVKIDGYQTMEITEASHLVQRSAYPDAVADHEPEGRVFASALTGYSPAALTCRLRPPSQPGAVQAVRDLLVRDLGDVETSVAPDAPSVLWLGAGSGEAGERRAWVLAHWSVAHAGALDVTRVAVGDRVWRRDRPDAGWARAEQPQPAGRVLVEVSSPETS
jgi:hypothetical protein